MSTAYVFRDLGHCTLRRWPLITFHEVTFSIRLSYELIKRKKEQNYDMARLQTKVCVEIRVYVLQMVNQGIRGSLAF